MPKYEVIQLFSEQLFPCISTNRCCGVTSCKHRTMKILKYSTELMSCFVFALKSSLCLSAFHPDFSQLPRGGGGGPEYGCLLFDIPCVLGWGWGGSCCFEKNKLIKNKAYEETIQLVERSQVLVGGGDCP